MTQYAFYFDGTRCSGCKTCVYACKDTYDLGPGRVYRRVFEYAGGTTTKDKNGYITTDCYSYPISVSCNHCDQASCIAACPTGAMKKDGETGLVYVDKDQCIGCGSCAVACPYSAPTIDHEQKRSVKCDGCMALVKKGEVPVCVASCPARALDFGTTEEIKAKYPDAIMLDMAPMPNPNDTLPNMFVKPSKDARLWTDREGELANRVITTGLSGLSRRCSRATTTMLLRKQNASANC